MRIRYAYKLTLGDGNTTFVVLNHKKSDEEVLEMNSEKGCTQASFYERVRTGYRLDQTGNLVETGLAKPQNAPKAAPAKPAPEKAKGQKAKKAQ